MSEASRSVTLRRLWLDTFDWRLYHSGLTLEQVTRGGAADLVLTGRDGTVLAADRMSPPHGGGRARAPWPGRLDTLPLGPLRDHLGPVVGVRALLPVARAVSVVREARVLNSDEKTMARITVDRMSVTLPGGGHRADPRGRDGAARLPAAGAAGGRPAGRGAGGQPAAASPALEAVLTAAGQRARRLHRQGRRQALPADARGGGDGRGADHAVRHPAGQRERHGARHRHRVPARPAGRGAAHPVRAQADRRRAARRHGRPVPPGVQVAGRPDHADPRPRRLPARLPGHGGRPGGRDRRRSCSRSTITWSAAAPRRSGSWPAACARPGSPGWAGNGGRPWRSPPATVRPAAGRRGWPPAGSAARTGACCATAARSARPRPRRACTSCASAARSCATCWSSSGRCTIRASTGRRSVSSRPCRTAWASSRTPRCSSEEIRIFAAQMMAAAHRARGHAAGHGRDRGRARPPGSSRPAASSPAGSREFASPAGQSRFRALTGASPA